MFPDLIDLGFIHLKTYGACMAVGFLLCWTLVERLSGRRDLSNLLLALMVSGVVGSRVAYVIEHWSAEFAARPLSVIRVDQGGLMFYGGFILALTVFAVWCAVRRENPFALADLLATVIPLGHACGRIGCFFYGCCYGRLSDSPLAVSFPAHSPAWYEQYHAGLVAASATKALPVLPTQLFEAAALLGLFGVLFALRRRPHVHGFLTGVYLVGYAVLRFALEYLRGDPRAAVGPFSISQTISLGMLVLGVILIAGSRFGRRMTACLLISFAATAALSAFGERQPFERYESIIDRQMFGPPPEGFDPTKRPDEVKGGREAKKAEQELTKEQEKLKSAIHFSMINVTPGGETAVGFTDSSDSKNPINYYLKVGETRNGWMVKEADPAKGSMTIVKDDVEVSLSIGDNSAKGGGKTSAAGGERQTGRTTGRFHPQWGGSAVGSLGSKREARRRAEEQALEAKFDKKWKEREAEFEKKQQEREAELEKREQEQAAEHEDQQIKLKDLAEKLKRNRKAAAEKQEAENTEPEKSESEKPESDGSQTQDQ